jgi:hypothetical protein
MNDPFLIFYILIPGVTNLVVSYIILLYKKQYQIEIDRNFNLFKSANFWLLASLELAIPCLISWGMYLYFSKSFPLDWKFFISLALGLLIVIIFRLDLSKITETNIEIQGFKITLPTVLINAPYQIHECYWAPLTKALKQERESIILNFKDGLFKELKMSSSLDEGVTWFATVYLYSVTSLSPDDRERLQKIIGAYHELDSEDREKKIASIMELLSAPYYKGTLIVVLREFGVSDSFIQKNLSTIKKIVTPKNISRNTSSKRKSRGNLL